MEMEKYKKFEVPKVLRVESVLLITLGTPNFMHFKLLTPNSSNFKLLKN